jgi:hypothetical protein
LDNSGREDLLGELDDLQSRVWGERTFAVS